MATKITSPIEGFTGRTTIGPLTLDFQDGVAETDEKIPDAIRAYLHRRGYTTGRAKAPKDEAFDPGAHTADEVTAYLANHQYGSEEYARVVQAERDGKARKGLLEAFDKADADAQAAAEEAARAAADADAGAGDGTQGGGDGS